MMFYALFDIGMAVIMFIIGILFYKSNGKAANFLSGYNMRSTEERKKYNEIQMCRDYGKRMICMAIPFLIGAVIDIQFVGTGCLVAWRLWLIMFIFYLLKGIKENGNFWLIGMIKNHNNLWVQKITIAFLKNGLSLFFTFSNIESAAISNNKTIAAHARVHLPF